MPIADLAIVARLEEARIALAFKELADDWRPVAGGFMARAAPGSWLNALVGGGLGASGGGGGSPELDTAEIIEFYASKGIEPRIEICTLAGQWYVAAIEKAGFVVRSFDNVLFRPISRGDAFATASPSPDGLVIETVDPSDPAAVREYVIGSISGFFPAGAPLPDVAIESAERAVRHPRSISFVARIPRDAGSRVVAAGGMEVSGEISCLYGLSVAEPFRRRGVQQAMLAHRLRVAAEYGAKYATIGSRPGAHTERNVRRMGFELAYTKVCVVKPGPGLVGMFES